LNELENIEELLDSLNPKERIELAIKLAPFILVNSVPKQTYL